MGSVTVEEMSTGATAPKRKEVVVRRHSKDPPLADHRVALNRLVRRLNQARELAVKQSDPALVGFIDSALDSATNLLESKPQRVVRRKSRTVLLIASVKALELLVEEIISRLIDTSLHSLF